MKRFIALFLSLIMLISLSACGKTVVREEGSCGKLARWTLDSDGVLTISGRKNMDEFLYHGTPWHDSRENIRAVVVEEGITHLGDNAFEGCEKLETVTLAESVTSMGISVFANCPKLVSVTGSEHLTQLGDNAFDSCESLTALELNAELTAIGRCAFYNCTSLASVTIPETVTFIDSFAFFGWTEEQSVNISLAQPHRAWSDTWDHDSNAVFNWNA